MKLKASCIIVAITLAAALPGFAQADFGPMSFAEAAVMRAVCNRETCPPLMRQVLSTIVRGCRGQPDQNACAARTWAESLPAISQQAKSWTPPYKKHFNDPGAVPLCRPPYHMTARDGCQPPR
jgi:hypothetical protein